MTFELSLKPGDQEAALLEALAALGVHDYAEAAAEPLDVDDADWEAAYSRWDASQTSLYVIYRSTEAEVQALLDKLQSALGRTLLARITPIDDQLWQEAWASDFRFLRTRKFLIAPEDEIMDGEGRIVLQLASGSVFGSGQHATTQALLQLMERVLKPGAGERLLDVGTGTGVLAFAAFHLGYTHCLGTDIHPDAIDVATANAQRNQLPLELHLGSLPDAAEAWDVIVCNILPPTLNGLFPELKARLKKGGSLCLAGFNQTNAESVREDLNHLGLVVCDEESERGWLAWQVRL